MRRFLGLVTVLALAFTAVVTGGSATAGAQEVDFPDVVHLPDGFSPEGIATDGRTAYTGSLIDGRILKVNLKTGEFEEFAPSPGPGKIAVGMDIDRRDRLWVAGGGGALLPGVDAGFRVYDKTGDLITDVVLPDGAFVNDVIVTKNTAWFTDSFRPVLYRVRLFPSGGLSAVETVALGGDWQQPAGGLSANGIAATVNGEFLIVAQVTAPDVPGSALYSMRADRQADELDATRIEIDGALNGADGLILAGRTLYVIGGPDGVTKMRISGGLTQARVVDTIAVPGVVSPTTADLNTGRLMVVDANFPLLGDPTSTHTFTAVPR